ncbi:DUF2637 domain-containing protein [Streptomyces piniterrae]|uniref:DUF2637 domain-containing protein n=1 Tax=Streptomyces piniterrae TaxID=2571125 RepID=A0A4U0ML63_9ACTN|nr:DUF2637 domain-containing protein [Streptomyces piniterrae]TJZ41196.1 DUF2637 domain-containing protein [Streptomyces piniterrae]
MSYREERRADQAAERTQDREDLRLKLEAQLKAKEITAEQKRQDDEAKREQARKDVETKRRQQQADKKARAQEKERKRAARRAKFGKVTGWLNRNPVTAFVGFVMVCSIVPAVISQVGALSDAGVFPLLAALLSAMLEGTAWALTFMGKAAEDAGRPAGKYRIATWVTAVLAAGVNYWHWSSALPGEKWVAVVFAASSLIAIYLWDMKTHGSHGKTKEERRREKARKKHFADRRKHHKDIAAEADRLLSALPFESVTDEEAFATAWQIKKGTQQGLSAEIFAEVTDARVNVGAAFELAEHVRPELIRAGMLANLHNPLPGRFAEGIPTLGPSISFPALQRGSESPTAQAGIGVYGSEAASEKASEKVRKNDGGNASGNGSRGRSDEELEQLLPEAHRVAVDLVAEGKQISAAALAKHLKIRREDGMKLRDRVVAERKLKLVDSTEPAALGA